MRPIRSLVVLLLMIALAACANVGSKPVKEILRLDLSVVAAVDVNPDDQKRAAPIVVRVYELKTDAAFNAADYFSLQDKDRTVLADDLVVRDEFMLRPGETKSIRRPSDPSATVLCVLAAYRDLPHAVWRVTYALPVTRDAAWYRRGTTLKVNLDVGADALKVTESK